MKTFFWKKIRKATSGTLVLTLLFSVFSPLGNLAFAVPVTTFTATETVANVVAGADNTQAAVTAASQANVVAVQSVTTFTVDVIWMNTDTVTIDGCTITFTNAWVPDNDCTDNVGLIDPSVDGSPAQQATALAGFSFTNYTAAAGWAGKFVLTHSTTAVDWNPSSSEVWASVSESADVVWVAAAVQENTITIGGVVEAGDIYTATLPTVWAVNYVALPADITTDGNNAASRDAIAAKLNAAILASAGYAGQDFTSSVATNVVTLTAKVAGTGFVQTSGNANRAAVAQQVTFTPVVPTVGKTLSGSINGTSYNYTITGSMTVAQAVTAFQPLIDADASVSCADSTTTVTCTSATPGTAFTYAAEVVDITAPTVSTITFDDTALKIGDTAVVTIVLSEAASGATFASDDVTLANGTLGTLTTADNVTWTGTFTPTASVDDSTNIATVGTGWTDIAGNSATLGATSANYVIDTVAPTVVLSTGAPNPTNGAFTVTATFVGGVSGMAIEDFVVVNGTASGFVQDSSMIYTAVVTPTADGVVTVNMGTGAATDSAGNNSDAAVELSLNYDATAPIISAVNVTPDISGTGATYSYAVADAHAVTSSIFLGTGSSVLATLTTSGSSTGTGTHTGSLSGLSTGTTYYYFVESTDSVGNTGTTSTGSFSTGDSVGPVISNRHIDGITETGATVKFDFTDANYTIGTGTGHVTLGTGASLSNIATGYLTIMTGSVNNASSAFNSLTSDTTYNYAISVTDDFGNVSSTSTGSFVTADTPVVLSGGIIYETGATALTGATMASGSTLDLSGTTIIISSDPNDTNSITGTLMLSGVAGITVSGLSWNGILIPPTLIQSGATENATNAEISAIIPQTSSVTVGNTTTTTTYAATILETVKLGGESGVSLIASGSNFRVSFVVSASSSGTVLNLYRSANGTVWEVNSPDATCTLDASKMCTFNTNHLSYFAPTLIASSASSVTTSSGGGGGGGGGISMDYCPTGDKSGSYYDGKCNEVVVVTATGTTTTTTNTDGTVITITTPTVGVLLFLDISNNWAKIYIEALAKAGIVNNTQYFRPNDSVTRAEFLKMTLNGLRIETDKTLVKSEFSDVEATWQIPFIAKAKAMWIASGQVINGELSFRPNDNITRAEAMKILLNAAGYNAVAISTNFTDVITPWQIPFVVRAQELGIVSGQMIDGQLRFRPNDAMTRAEVSKIIVKTIQMK